MNKKPPLPTRKATMRLARLAAVTAALAVVATACGGASTATPSESVPSAPAAPAPPPPSTTPEGVTTAPPTAPKAETPAPVPSSTSTPAPTTANDVADDDEASDGYLLTDEVEEYIAAFTAGLEASSITIDGTQFPVTSASAAEGLLVEFDGGLVEVTDLEDFESAMVLWDDQRWASLEEPEFLARPEALDGDGDRLHLNFDATTANDPTASISVDFDISVAIIGMGNSVVEVVDNFVAISGTLGTETYIQVAEVVANSPEVDTVVLTNVEGSENDEINVHTARLIRSAGWTTFVPSNGDISSGGVDMFLAGVERILEPGAFVGVHSWADSDGTTGRDYARDHPVHAWQIAYAVEMLGEEAGTDFYFYAIESAPAEQIHRMSREEIERFGVATSARSVVLPDKFVGNPAGYAELAEGIYIKLEVESCSIADGVIVAELFNSDFGQLDLDATGLIGELAIPDLLGIAPTGHDITDIEIADGTVSGVIDFDIADLVDGLDISAAEFEIPCTVAR